MKNDEEARTVVRHSGFAINSSFDIRASSFLTNRVALAAAGPVAVERARDIDRSLLLSAFRQEQNAATRSSRRNVRR